MGGISIIHIVQLCTYYYRLGGYTVIGFHDLKNKYYELIVMVYISKFSSIFSLTSCTCRREPDSVLAFS